MHRQILSLITAVLVVMAAFVSCKKDRSDGSGTSGGDGKLLPSEIIYTYSDGYSDVLKISYNNDNRVTKVEWYFEDVLHYEDIYAYDGSGRLIKITYIDSYFKEDDYAVSLAYSGNFVTITWDDEEDYAEKYELQGDKVIKIYDVEYDEMTLVATCDYDSKGNIIKILSEYEYQDDDYDDYYHSISEVSVTYADRKGIYAGINMPNWFLMNDIITEGSLGPQAVNNPYLINQRVEYTEIWGGEEYSGVDTYTTTYNYEEYREDFPEKFTTTWEADDNPVKKSKVLQGFNKKNKRSKRSSDDGDYFEVKYIEAR